MAGFEAPSTAFEGCPVQVSVKFHGDGELYAVFDARCDQAEWEEFQAKQGYDREGRTWRLPLGVDQLKQIVPWKQTFNIEPDEISAVLAMAAEFFGFLDVRDGGGCINAVVLLCSGDLVALRATFDERCSMVFERGDEAMEMRDLTCIDSVRAGSMEELRAKASDFIRAFQDETVSSQQIALGCRRFLIDAHAGIPLSFFQAVPFRSTGDFGLSGDSGIAVCSPIVSPLDTCRPLFEHRLRVPKLLRYAFVLNKGEPRKAFGGTSDTSYEVWVASPAAQEYQQQLYKSFMKDLRRVRNILELESKKAASGKLDKLQEEKLQRKQDEMRQLSLTAVYLEDDSDLAIKNRDILESEDFKRCLQ
mmetsp:Transcript_60661/g.130223  ORF Transcript_60661/g.130223 Transcript_60661/m.130223 type:complete len:361 (+) Transcript_60661:92-1174(+)